MGYSMKDTRSPRQCSCPQVFNQNLIMSLHLTSSLQGPLCVLSSSVVSDSLGPHELEPSRLLCPWNSPSKNMGVDCHFLLQEIFLTQGSNLLLLHWQAESLPLSHQGSPKVSVTAHTNFCSQLPCLKPPLSLSLHIGLFNQVMGRKRSRAWWRKR